MAATVFLFYLFSILTLGSAFMVISGRNAVHSVLFLIFAFANAAGLFMLLGAEFLAMLIIVVYVGAVAVLFLFVVMMLDVDFGGLRHGVLQYLPLGSVLGVILLIELVMVVGGWTLAPAAQTALGSPTPAGVSNTVALGRILYTQYFYFFQIAGFILLTAMIGSIVLTLHHRRNVKRQSVEAQNARDRRTSVTLQKVPSRVGL